MDSLTRNVASFLGTGPSPTLAPSRTPGLTPTPIPIATPTPSAVPTATPGGSASRAFADPVRGLLR